MKLNTIIERSMRPIRVVLILWMIWNTGFVQFLYNSKLPETPQVKLTYEESISRQRKYCAFVNEKVAKMNAKLKRGEIYTIYDYFDDFAEITNYADKLEIPQVNSFTEFDKLYQQPLSTKFTDQDLENARNSYNRKTGKPTEPKPINWSSIFLSWYYGFLNQILKDLIPIFIILLFKFFKDYKCEKVSFELLPLKIFLDEIFREKLVFGKLGNTAKGHANDPGHVPWFVRF